MKIKLIDNTGFENSFQNGDIFEVEDNPNYPKSYLIGDKWRLAKFRFEIVNELKEGLYHLQITSAERKMILRFIRESVADIGFKKDELSFFAKNLLLSEEGRVSMISELVWLEQSNLLLGGLLEKLAPTYQSPPLDNEDPEEDTLP